MLKIIALVVTYNRLEKLRKCLEAYENQTVAPYKIIVVDNFSNDGTKEFLREWGEKENEIAKKIIYLDKNYGGSGGFYSGMKAAMEEKFDWLWISDDDAYPEKNAFEILCGQSEKNKKYDVICSSVITEEGIDTAHRKIIQDSKNYFGAPVEEEQYQKEKFDINIFSFVGSAISKKVLEECGLPQKNYFIWFDDTEYALRVNKKFNIMCVPDIRVFHDTIIEKEWKYSWKTYYGERNKLYTLQKHLPQKIFKNYLLHYRLGMIKHFITDHRYYLSQKDGYNDFRKGILGVPDNHRPGRYKY